MKILLIVRDPVQRLISHFTREKYFHKQLFENGNIVGSSMDNIFLDKEGHLRTKNIYVIESSYFIHLKNWYRSFPSSQIHIIESTELVNNPRKLLYKVETFLEIEHEIKENVFYFNETKGFYCYIKDGNKQCMPKHKGLKHVVLSKHLLEELTEYFEPLNKQFFELINKTYNW